MTAKRRRDAAAGIKCFAGAVISLWDIIVLAAAWYFGNGTSA
jgi:hypothetical protein